MGKKSKPPPAPDYSGLIQSANQQAQYSYQLGQQQLLWAKEQYASDKEMTQQVIDAALARQNEADANARKDRARYEQIFQPLEDNLVKTANDYASEGRQDAEAGKASANVSQQFGLARAAAQDRLESFGIDPSQVRAGALDTTSRMSEAAARASAANMARTQVQQTGLALQQNAVNVGRGYPGQVASSYGTGLASGNQAANTGLATTASGANTMGTGLQWTGAGNQSLGQIGGFMNSAFQNQMSRYEAQQKQSSGIGGILGTVAGLAGSFMGFEEGGAVPEGADPAAMAAADPAMHRGIPVREEHSPSRGINTDDVPARLNVGEFVVPKRTLSWYGEKHFQGLVDKADKEKAGATAKPEYKPARRGLPTIH